MGKPIYIVIAGPQSSGKSTAIEAIREKFPEAKVYKEINPFTVSKKGERHKGGAFVTPRLQKRIQEANLARLKTISRKRKGIYLEETGVLGLAHAKMRLGEKAVNDYLGKYKKVLGKLNAAILFIDTRPEVSWKRRKDYYAEKAKEIKSGEKRKEVLQRYKDYLYKIYPEFHRILGRLNVPVKIYKNGDSPVEKFKKEILREFSSLLQELKNAKS